MVTMYIPDSQRDSLIETKGIPSNGGNKQFTCYESQGRELDKLRAAPCVYTFQHKKLEDDPSPGPYRNGKLLEPLYSFGQKGVSTSSTLVDFSCRSAWTVTHWLQRPRTSTVPPPIAPYPQVGRLTYDTTASFQSASAYIDYSCMDRQARSVSQNTPSQRIASRDFSPAFLFHTGRLFPRQLTSDREGDGTSSMLTGGRPNPYAASDCYEECNADGYRHCSAIIRPASCYSGYWDVRNFRAPVLGFGSDTCYQGQLNPDPRGGWFTETAEIVGKRYECNFSSYPRHSESRNYSMGEKLTSDMVKSTQDDCDRTPLVDYSGACVSTKLEGTIPADSPGNSENRNRKCQCPYCNFTCSNKGQLKGHVRVHTGEKPFVCPMVTCGKTFARNEELTRHQRIHSGFRPHHCDCGKKFSRKDHLNKHKRTHLNSCEKRIHACTVTGCDKRYTRSDALARHQWSGHGISPRTTRLN